MVLSVVMAFGGPVLWWILRAASRTPASFPARAARDLGTFTGLIALIVSGIVLLLVWPGGAAHDVATATWLVGGLLTVWSTSRGSWSLPGLVATRTTRHIRKVRSGAAADAEAGDPAAMYLLGVTSKLDGDLDGARTWLQKAAEAGVRDAQWDLGRLLDEVDGPQAARPWFAAAAEAGHPGALSLLRPGSAYGRAADPGPDNNP